MQKNDAKCLNWVKTGKAQCEHMFSAVLPISDIRHKRHGMPKAYRFTLTMPACVTVDAIGRVDFAVLGSSAPLPPMNSPTRNHFGVLTKTS